jgi:Holliday junction resolvase-like predicted endonuclease
MTEGNGQREPATPQEIWEILREVSAAQQETDQLLKRQARAADRRMDKLDELFNGQWGKLMEALVEGDLVKLLQQRGIAVQHTVTNPRQNYGERRWEFDIVAINGEEVVVVEVKTTLRVPDIDHFVGRLNEFAELMPEYADRRIYGAVAYLKAYQESDVRAERLGLFVIRATGSSASITNREEFTPRTFGHRSTALSRQ